MYKQLLELDGSVANTIKRLSDGAVIPADPANTDYQEYLEWTKASLMNVALPAEEADSE